MTLPNANLSDPGRMPSTKTPADPELVAVKRLVGLLDRSYRNSTLYGKGSAAAHRFIEQFQVELVSHIALHGGLTLVVQGFRLLCKGAVVYENPSPLENMAFKLFSDGIRELSFRQDVSREDVTNFMEALGGDYDTTADDDIVSRLWQKNLPTISVVTAEEIMQSLDSVSVIKPQDADIMNRPVSQVSTIHKDEERRQAQETVTGSEAREAGDPRSGSGLAEYQVSKEELAKLAREIEEESRQNSATLVLEMVTAILMSEQPVSVLLKTLDVCGAILAGQIERGHWDHLNRLLSLLEEVANRPEVTVEYKVKLKELRERLVHRDRLSLIATALNPSAQSNIDGMLPFLLRFNASVLPGLCALLGKLKHREHRAVICHALLVLAKDEPEPLLKLLSQPAGEFIIEVIDVLLRLVRSHEEQMTQYDETYSNVGVPLPERVVQALTQVVHHTDAKVKREALRAIGTLCPAGSGMSLMAFVLDGSDGVRLAALKQLATGGYTVPFSAWKPVVSDAVFLGRLTSEKQAIFTAMSQTAQGDTVAYWRELLTRWSWTNRAQVRELATLAAEFLGKMGTAEANEALEVGMKRWDRTIRNACKRARAAQEKQVRAQAASHGQP